MIEVSARISGIIEEKIQSMKDMGDGTSTVETTTVRMVTFASAEVPTTAKPFTVMVADPTKWAELVMGETYRITIEQQAPAAARQPD